MYQNILVAYDGSEFSRSALIEVANWVKIRGGNILLLHVIENTDQEFAKNTDEFDKRWKQAKEICQTAQDDLKNHWNIPVEFIILEGDPSKIIIQTAKEHHIDLIAMGTYGRKRLKRWVLGSVILKVLSQINCDFLIVKKHCTECHGQYQSILVPINNLPTENIVIQKACDLAHQDKSNITLLYVVPQYEKGFMGMMGFVKTKSIQNTLHHDAQKTLDKLIPVGKQRGIPIQSEIIDGDPAERIEQYASKMNNDLIIMNNNGWLNSDLISTTTDKVILDNFSSILLLGKN